MMSRLTRTDRSCGGENEQLPILTQRDKAVDELCSGKERLHDSSSQWRDFLVVEVVRMNMIVIDSEIGEARELAKARRSATVKICVDVTKSAQGFSLQPTRPVGFTSQKKHLVTADAMDSTMKLWNNLRYLGTMDFACGRYIIRDVMTKI
jgi:hypothetical protein